MKRQKSNVMNFMIVMLLVVMMVCTAVFAVACTKTPGGNSGSASTGSRSSTGSTSGSTGDSSGNQPSEESPVRIPVTGTVRYDFDVVAGYGKISGKKYNAVTGEGVSVRSKEGVGSWVTGFTWENEASATLNIYADKECEADVGLKVRKTEEKAVLTSKVSVSIGGEVIDSEAEVDKSEEGADADFDEVNLGRFTLSEGENEIKIVPMDSTDNFSFMSVIIYTDDEEANLRWKELKDVTGAIFYGINEKVVLTGDYTKNYSENCIGVSGYNGATAKFPIYSSRQAKAKISFITCSMSGVSVFTDFYNFSVNGDRKHSNAVTLSGPVWGDYGIVTIGEYVIEKGLNEITLTSFAGFNYNFYHNIRAVIVDTDATIDWNEVAEEAHVCLSKCDVCGGCLNAACEEEDCATKCTCAHVCVSLCSVCGGCKNADCDKFACKTKCACEEKTLLAYGNAIVEQGKYDDSQNLGCATLDQKSYRTKFRYVIDAKQAGKAELSIIISSTTGGVFNATDVYVTTINETAYTSDAKTVNDNVAWVNFHTIKLGVIDLKQGRNIIAFDHVHINDITALAAGNWGDSVNFRAIVLNTSVDYSVGHDVCLSECEVCGGCKNADCTETVCEVKCSCALYTFNAVDDKVVISDGLSKNKESNFVDVTDLSTLQKVTFKINSSKAQKINLGFCLSKNPTAVWAVADYFRIWINVAEGEENDTTRLSKDTYTTETTQGSGAEFVDAMLGAINLKEGENTITIAWTCVNSEAYKFTLRSLLIEAGAEVTLI